jgi:hypothetical protein
MANAPGSPPPHRARTKNFRHSTGPALFDRILDCINYMRSQKVDLPLMLWGITDLNELIAHPTIVFEKTALLVSIELPVILEKLYLRPRKHNAGRKSKAGKAAFESFAFEVVRKSIESEIRALKPVMRLEAKNVTAETYLSIDMKSLIAEAKAKAPKLWDLLRHTAYTDKQMMQNQKKNPEPVVLYMICTAMFFRSPQHSKMTKMVTFYLKSCGLAAKAFDALHMFGITLLRKWAYKTVRQIAKQATASMLCDIKTLQFHCSHDNVNIAFRVQEQRLDNQSHFDSGTAGTVYIFADQSIPRPDNRLLQTTQQEGCTHPVTRGEIIQLAVDAAPRLRALAIYHILSIMTDTPAFNIDKYDEKKSPVLERPASNHELPHNGTVQYMLETIHQASGF